MPSSDAENEGKTVCKRKEKRERRIFLFRQKRAVFCNAVSEETAGFAESADTAKIAVRLRRFFYSVSLEKWKRI